MLTSSLGIGYGFCGIGGGEMLINEARARKILAERKLDGLLAATNIPNVFYLSGIWRRADVAAMVHHERLTLPWVALPRAEVDYIVGAVPPAGVVTFGTFYRALDDSAKLTERETRIKELGVDLEPVKNFFEAIVVALQNAELADATVGYDERGLDPALVGRLQERLPKLKLIPADATFRDIRCVKSTDELDRISAAVRVTEDAIQEAARQAREGMLEKDVCLAFDLAQVRRGAYPNMNHVGFGRSAALGMTNVAEDRLKPGDMIRFDVGCIYRGYATDLSRTFAFGPPPDKIVKYYNAILKGQDRALAMIRPGITGAEIFEAAVEEVRRTGIPRYGRQHVGHGIGIGLAGYDKPLLAPGDRTPLEPNMVLCVETPYYELGWGSVQVEDMIVVTEDGHRRLTTMGRELQVLELRA